MMKGASTPKPSACVAGFLTGHRIHVREIVNNAHRICAVNAILLDERNYSKGGKPNDEKIEIVSLHRILERKSWKTQLEVICTTQ